MDMITGASRLDARRWAVPAAMAMKAALALAFVVALSPSHSPDTSRVPPFLEPNHA